MSQFDLPTDAVRHREALHCLWAAEMQLLVAAQFPSEVLATPEIAGRLRKCREALAKIEIHQPNQGEHQ